MANFDKAKKPIGESGFQAKITIGTFVDTSFWSKVSGTAKEYQISEYSDGNTNVLLPFAGAVKYSAITIEKPFLETDADLYNKILGVNSSPDFLELSIQPMYKDAYFSKSVGGIIIIKQGVIETAKLFGDLDSGGNNPAMMSVVFRPGGITSQGSVQWWLEATNAVITTTSV